LADVPIKVDWVYRQGVGPRVIYFEAHKAAAASLWQLEGFTIAGWLVEGTTGRRRALHLTGSLVTGESNGLGSRLRVPLGFLRLGDRVLWVSALHGYESLEYAIDEIMASDVRQVIAVNAGGC
jgi:hypothetical protein